MDHMNTQMINLAARNRLPANYDPLQRSCRVFEQIPDQCSLSVAARGQARNRGSFHIVSLKYGR